MSGYEVDPEKLTYDAAENFGKWAESLDKLAAMVPVLQRSDFSWAPGGKQCYVDCVEASDALVRFIEDGAKTFTGFADFLTKTREYYEAAESDALHIVAALGYELESVSDAKA